MKIYDIPDLNTGEEELVSCCAIEPYGGQQMKRFRPCKGHDFSILGAMEYPERQGYRLWHDEMGRVRFEDVTYKAIANHVSLYIECSVCGRRFLRGVSSRYRIES